MKDPYEVLGVDRSATDEELLQARNKIIEEYGAENHEGNPLAHLAQEKIRDANAAYDYVINQREQIGDAQPSQFLDIRRLINANRITQAEELLEGVSPQSRDAEWYFLKGSVYYSRGWLEDAYENFSRAAQMNPQNAEYRAALSQLQWQRQTGRSQANFDPEQQPQMVSGCNVCDMCAAMYCANCCCSCMGNGCR